MDSVHREDNQPEIGFATEGRVIRIVDADTIDVEIKRVVRVRLSHPNSSNLDFNAPERRTEAGKKAIVYISQWLMGNTVTVFFPAKSPDLLLDNTSFNRIIGEVWCGGQRVTQKLLEYGYAKLSKRGHYDEEGDVGNSSSNTNAS